MRTQYRIIGRFAKDVKPHVVDMSPSWTNEDAKHRLAEIIEDEKRAKLRGYHAYKAGLIGISSPYYSEYELLDLKIQSRQVSSWGDID